MRSVIIISALALCAGCSQNKVLVPSMTDHDPEIALAHGVEYTTDPECAGNACDCAWVEWDAGQGCYLAENTCSKRVHFDLTRVKFWLRPGKSKYVKVFNRCLQAFPLPYKVNY